LTTILVVDDREENRTLIRYLFDEPAYRVLEASNGLEGITVARAERPDCVLLDLAMPGLSGFEVLEHFGRDPRTREIPVLILTATDESLEGMERALRAGAVDYITKPISPLRVAVRVRGAIERRRLLREVQELRGAFTSMLVHDLRAPLTVISAYVDLLRQITGGPEAETQRTYLKKTEESCNRMIGLIEEILDLSKLEAGKLSINPQPMDLAALATDVAERFLPAAAQKGVTLTIDRGDSPQPVLVDANRIDQVLMNLLGNALKFTPAGGAVGVEVLSLVNDVEVAVVDSGPGILPEEMPLLFEKFSQTASAKSVVAKGTGLGLVICRHLVEAHGGRIWVENRPRKGCRFAFRLPLMGHQTEAPAARRKRAILIVDDDARVAHFLGDVLVADGHRVEIATGPALALPMLAAEPYDVVISDIAMPEETAGPTLYRESLARHPELRARFIFITGYGLGAQTRQFLEETGVPCLSKPFALEQIESFVQRIPLNPAVDMKESRSHALA
jgi:signal transduction histidine kinase